MANGLYTKAKEGFLDGSIIWMNDNIKAALIDTSAYTVNLTSHSFMSDVPSGAIVATSANLDSKSATDGVADATDVTFTSVTGASVEAIIVYKDTGSSASSRLIAYIDTGTGLPFTPNAGNIIIAWSSGSDRIFRL